MSTSPPSADQPLYEHRCDGLRSHQPTVRRLMIYIFAQHDKLDIHYNDIRYTLMRGIVILNRQQASPISQLFVSRDTAVDLGRVPRVWTGPSPQSPINYFHHTPIGLCGDQVSEIQTDLRLPRLSCVQLSPLIL